MNQRESRCLLTAERGKKWTLQTTILRRQRLRRLCMQLRISGGLMQWQDERDAAEILLIFAAWPGAVSVRKLSDFSAAIQFEANLEPELFRLTLGPRLDHSLLTHLGPQGTCSLRRSGNQSAIASHNNRGGHSELHHYSSRARIKTSDCPGARHSRHGLVRRPPHRTRPGDRRDPVPRLRWEPARRGLGRPVLPRPGLRMCKHSCRGS